MNASLKYETQIKGQQYNIIAKRGMHTIIVSRGNVSRFGVWKHTIA